MDKKTAKTLIRDTFNTVADGYDHPALRFFSDSAGRLASLMGLRGNEHVLDVATGTGNAALALAGFLPEGRVTGVDFSSFMLEQARKKAAALNIRNTDFIEGDMETLEFPTASFDAAVCAFGIFFVENMAEQLARIAATVRPGGRVATTSFAENYFHPLKDLLLERLSGYGVALPPPAWKKVSTERACMDLFQDTGLRNVVVTRENMGYWLSDAEDWWNVVWNAGYRRLVSQLPQDDRERFKQEHLQEVDALKTGEGIRLDVDVLFSMGTIPKH